MPDGNRKPASDLPDADQLAKLLEIELMQKRASWQQAKARRGPLRAVSFLFLAVVLVGALFAFWMLFSSARVSELKQPHPQDVSPSPVASPQ